MGMWIGQALHRGVIIWCQCRICCPLFGHTNIRRGTLGTQGSATVWVCVLGLYLPWDVRQTKEAHRKDRGLTANWIGTVTRESLEPGAKLHYSLIPKPLKTHISFISSPLSLDIVHNMRISHFMTESISYLLHVFEDGYVLWSSISDLWHASNNHIRMWSVTSLNYLWS